MTMNPTFVVTLPISKIVEWYRYVGIVADIRDAIDARNEPRGKHRKQNAPSIIEKDSVRR